MKKTLFIYASALAIVCACSKTGVPAENPVQEEETVVPEGYVLYQLSSDLTKVAIGGEDGKTLSWEEGDKIKLVTDKGEYSSDALTEGGSSAMFTFAIPEGDTPLYGVYPATLECSANVEGGSLNVTFPKNVTAEYSNTNVMCGKVDGSSIAFKNVAHLIKFTTNKDAMSRIQISDLGESKIIGEASVVFNDEGVDVKPTGTGADGLLSNYVNGAGTYYIAVLPSDEPWAGIGIRTATGTTGKYSYSTGFIGTKPITPKRNTITNLGNIDNLFEEEVVVKDGNELAKILNTENNLAKIWYLNGKTLTLGEGTYTLASSPEIKNTKVGEGIEFTIQGAGESNTIINGDGKYRFIKVASGSGSNSNATSITIDGVTIQNCKPGENGGAISITGNSGSGKRASLTIKDSKLTQNGTTSYSGGALYTGAYSNITLDGCTFTGNSAVNGAAIYTVNGSGIKVDATDCVFNNETATTNGGAVCILGGTHAYDGCTFNGCSSTKSYGGAIHCNGSTTNLGLTGCTFKECKGYTEAKDKAKHNAGSAISLQDGEVSIEQCEFDGNVSSMAAGAVIYLDNKNNLLKVNNSTFKNNVSCSRGLIKLDGKSAAFFNNCSFYNNEMTTSDWGVVLHGSNPSVACFNNCTIYNNVAKISGGNSVCLNNDGSIVVTNSTIVNSNAKCLIRCTNATTTQVLVANSILLNEISDGKVFAYDANRTNFYTYNCYLGQTSAEEFSNGGKWTSTNDKKYISSLTGGQFDVVNKVYLWNGPTDADGFTKAKETDVKGYLENLSISNGNTKINGNFGPKFAEWVASVGVDDSRKNSFTYDALGNARNTDGTWPGAIEN